MWLILSESIYYQKRLSLHEKSNKKQIAMQIIIFDSIQNNELC